jgi:deoxyribonuclease V
MRIRQRHPWSLTSNEARRLQHELAAEVDATARLGRWKTIAAADVSSEWRGKELQAGVVVLRAGELELVERSAKVGPSPFPYVPGLLSFREAPLVLEAFANLRKRPDVVLVDGQGRAHPRRFGIASHLGLLLDLPTVGCAKTRLCGTYDEPGPLRGDLSPLRDGDEIIGAVVRTRDRVKPLFVSVGHRITLEGAVELVLGLSGKHRLPSPARLAHAYVNEIRRAIKTGHPIPE